MGFQAERLRWLSEDNNVIKEREQQERAGDVDRKWDGREGGIKRRERDCGIKRRHSWVSVGESKKKKRVIFIIQALAKSTDVCIACKCWIFGPCKNILVCRKAPLCLATIKKGRKEGKRSMRGDEWEKGKDWDITWWDCLVCNPRIHNAYISFMASLCVLTLRDHLSHSVYFTP